MSISVRAVLWPRPQNNGKYRIKYCITINRSRVYENSEHSVRKDQFVNGEVVNYPNAGLLNSVLRKRVSEIEQLLIRAELAGEKIDIKRAGEIILGKGTGVKFEEFALKIKAHKTELVTCLNRVKRYAPGLMLHEISHDWLRKFEDHERKRGSAHNTIHMQMKYIGRVVRVAYTQNVIEKNPFATYRPPLYIQQQRIYLKTEEVKLIEGKLHELSGATYAAAIYFLLGCYSGLRHSDWLQFSDKMVDDGKLRLRAMKNKSFLVLPIGPTLQGIIDRCTMPCPSLHECNKLLPVIAKIAGIEKKVTCHVARHSFGYLCAKNRLPQQVTAELMGIDLKTVRVYYHLAGEDIIDQAGILKTI